MQYKFSILIPAYKTKYLDEAIRSVINQTTDTWELIIVDDCSPEDVYAIVNKYGDKRIRYYRNEKNFGAINVIDNWNKCLDYSTGDYVICMGDDDCLLPCCLEEYLKLIEKYPTLNVYHGWTEIIDESSTFSYLTFPRPEYESVYSMIWGRWNGREQFIGDFAFLAKDLKSRGGFYNLPLAWASDDITAYRAASIHGIANTQALVFQYRKSNLTISSALYSEIKLESLKMEKKWMTSLLSIVPHNEIDLKYYRMIQNIFSERYKESYYSIILKDLEKESFFKYFYWYKQRSLYGVSVKTMIKLFLKLMITKANSIISF